MSKVYLLTLLLFISIMASAQKLSILANPVEGVSSELLQQQFDNYQVFQIDLRNLNREILKENPVLPLRFQFGNDHDWGVRLIPNDIRTENYQLRVASAAGDFKASRSRNKTFVGHVEGDSGGAARLTIDRNFIYGFFKYNDESYFIEPLKRFKEEAAPDQFLFYKASDVNPVPGQKCAVSEIKEGIGKQIQKEGTSTEKAVGQCYTVEIALAADFSMFSQFGSVSATENQVLGILNLVQSNYDDEFEDEINFEVVTVFVSDCPACDPWSTSTDAGTLLTSFANWGNNGGFGINFDVATLWTDRDFNGETIGVAWPGTLCTPQKYNTCQDFSFSASALRVLQAHELGHNFNAGHDAPGSSTIMAPSVNNTNDWSPTSQSEINSYVASVGANGHCFTNCAPALPPVASIYAPINNVCPGSVVPFFDNSANEPTSWAWSFPGGTPTASNQQNPTVVYELPGNYPVILTVTNDVGADATSLSFDINVTDAGTKYLVYETFELGPTNFVVDNPDGAITWELGNVGGTQGGNRAIFVNNYDYDAAGQKDALISLPFDFSGESDIMLELDYAYRRYNNNLKDKLSIFISIDGGNTFPFTAFQGDETGSGNFATAPDSQARFTPSTTNDWCFGTDFGADCISIDLSSLSGESNVVIKVENETGFGNNMYIDNLIITSSCQPLLAPSAAFTANVQQGCVPLEVTFENQSTGLITNYNWSFPGGTPAFSTMPNPTITYNFPGVYDVILAVGNAAGTSTAEEFAFVVVDGDPELAFNYTTEDLTAFFDNQSLGGNSFLWDFGDGNTSSAFNPNHTYAAAGEYTVVLSATNDCGTASLEQVVTITSPLIAGFSASETSGCADLEVNFTDESIGDIDQWEWTFEGGDPATSTAQNPTVTYQEAGIYAVTLTISNDLSEITHEEVNYITINDIPTAAFDINNSLGETNASFDNQSSNAESYNWDFGDGATSTDENPSHTYDTDGTYTVQMIATNACGNDTAFQEVIILTPPSASFTANVISGCTPFEVNFNGQPTGDGLTYAWTFEGGMPATSSLANPTVSYNTAGNFSVSLTVSNAAGSDTYEETAFITVDSLPTANFEISTVLGESSASFTNTSANALSYFWDFGDGNDGSFETNPTHNFAADGTYLIQLIASNACGNDTTTQEVTILSPPVAGFTTNSTSGCAPFEVNFSGQPTGDDLNYVWIFEGGSPDTSTLANPTVLYENTGTFSVSLMVSNAAGSDTIEETALITVDSLPTANFEISTTLGESEAAFTNTSANALSYSWDFGDGAQSDEANPNHAYDIDDTYQVQLIATNGCGSDTTLQELIILSPPVAGFTTNSTSGCAPFEVNFSGQPTGQDLNFIWIFEGGSPDTSTLANPTVLYENTGTFSVSLTVSNAAGSDTIEETALITVDSLPTANFEISTTLGESDAVFTNSSTDALSYSWDFGDGAQSDEANPNHTYDTDGTYQVQLIATNGCGSDTTLQELIILSPPIASFTANETNGCAPFEVSFSGQPTGEDLNYVWIFEGGSPDTSTLANPTVLYENTGTFSVSLVVSNAAGSDTIEETALITVDSLPTSNFNIDYNIGDNLAHFANTSIDATSYFWHFGDDSTSTAENPMHTYLVDGVYPITLIVENECGTDTLEQDLTIITPPKADFEASVTSGCLPFEVQFEGQTPSFGTTFAWTFIGGNPSTSTLQNPLVVYEDAGTYDVLLVLNNAAGADTAMVENFIVVESIPNPGFSSLVNGFTVQFENTSQAGSTFEWDFGDGNSSEEEIPTHVYETEGTFTVTLTVTNECGSASISELVEISVDFPTADFTASITEGCTPLLVQFTSLAENADSIAWSFPGGMPATSNELNPEVIYTEPGLYSILLEAYNAFGDATILEADLINVGTAPTAVFDFSISETTVVFSNNSADALSYTWDFGDDSNSTDSDPIHVFPSAGTFLVQLIATNLCGNDTLIQEVSIEGMAPVPSLIVETNRACLPLTIEFMDMSEGDPTAWLWTFAGAEPMTSSEQNPTVTYNQPGVYDVTLTVTNAFGTNTETFMEVMTILDIPEAAFSFETDGLEVNFQAQTSGEGLNYEWLFGDGTSSLEMNPMHTYPGPGTFEASLIVGNECGADTISMAVELIVDDLEHPAWVQQFELFPNPNAGPFNLLLEGEPQQALQIQLINVIGQVLYQDEMEFKTGYLKRAFDFTHLPKGMYLVQLRSGNSYAYKKVVLQ